MPNRWKPNVTVAAIVERAQRFLLVEEQTSDGLRLNTPAGHLDPAETPIQACVREVLEEAAYDFTPTALVGIYMNRFVRTRTGSDITYLRFAFSGELGTHHAQRLLDHGIVRTLWLTVEEIQAQAQLLRSPTSLGTTTSSIWTDSRMISSCRRCAATRPTSRAGCRTVVRSV